MRGVQDRSAGGFVNAAALHAHQTVFHDIDNADAVLAAQLVQLQYQRNRVHLFAVDRDGHALFKIDGNVFRLIGRFLRTYAHLHIALVFRLLRGILQLQTLVRKVPHILILGIIGFAADLQRHFVRFGVIDFLAATLDIPDSPRRDHRHIRRKRLDRQFEPNLIVALAGAAVADRVRALRLGDFHQPLCDHRTRKRRAQQIDIFIFRARLHTWEHVIFDKFLRQIFYIQLGSARLDRLFLQTLQLVRLTYVARYRDYLAALVIFLQPRDDDAGVQSARIGQYDLLVIVLLHSAYLLGPRCGRFHLMSMIIHQFPRKSRASTHNYVLLGLNNCIMVEQ